MTDNAEMLALDVLLVVAKEAAERAYAPYSGFHVGAALEGEDGVIFSGCNVENVSFGLTQCAERAAVTAAVAAGHRHFWQIVIYGGSTIPVSPCGACRQVLAEFAPTMEVISVARDGAQWRQRLEVLLPRPKEGILDVPRGT